MRKNKFTLIELISVIVIVSILAAIVLSNTKDITKTSKQSASAANIKNLQLAVDTYYLDNEKYPVTKEARLGVPAELNLGTLLDGYIRKEPKGEFKYWVDSDGLVFSSSADIPKNLDYEESTNVLSWEESENTEYCSLYKHEKEKIHLVKEKVSSPYNLSKDNSYFIQCVDELGNETPLFSVSELIKNPTVPEEQLNTSEYEYSFNDFETEIVPNLVEGENRFTFTLNIPVDYKDIKLKVSGMETLSMSIAWIENSNNEAIIGKMTYEDAFLTKAIYPIGDLAAGTHKFTMIVHRSCLMYCESIKFEEEFIRFFDNSLVYRAVDPEINIPTISSMTFIPFNENLYDKHVVELNVNTDFLPSYDYYSEADVINISIPQNAVNPILFVVNEDYGRNSYLVDYYTYDTKGEKYYPAYFYNFINKSPENVYTYRHILAVGYLRGEVSKVGVGYYSRGGRQLSEGIRMLNSTLTYYTLK